MRTTWGTHILRAALAGCGLAYLPDDMVKSHIDSGDQVPVPGAWCQPFPAYQLYFPTRRQTSPAFKLLVNALREVA